MTLEGFLCKLDMIWTYIDSYVPDKEIRTTTTPMTPPPKGIPICRLFRRHKKYIKYLYGPVFSEQQKGAQKDGRCILRKGYGHKYLSCKCDLDL